MSRRTQKDAARRQFLRDKKRRERSQLAALVGEQVPSSHTAESVADWPIVVAYVPVPQVRQATGFGTAAIVREQPNGRAVYSLAVLGVAEGGLKIPGGKADVPRQAAVPELEEFLQLDHTPPSQPGPATLAGEFVWGALALSLDRGFSWGDRIGEMLNPFPRPPGLTGDWMHRFIGPGGLVPDSLRELVDELPHAAEEDLPQGKELLVMTTVGLLVPDAQRLAELLDSAEPDITFTGQNGSARSYDITRPYPRGHWSPISMLGGARQNIGTLKLDGDRVTIEAKTLSFAARHIHRLLKLYGPGLELRDARYWSPNQSARDPGPADRVP